MYEYGTRQPQMEWRWAGRDALNLLDHTDRLFFFRPIEKGTSHVSISTQNFTHLILSGGVFFLSVS